MYVLSHSLTYQLIAHGYRQVYSARGGKRRGNVRLAGDADEQTIVSVEARESNDQRARLAAHIRVYMLVHRTGTLVNVVR